MSLRALIAALLACLALGLAACGDDDNDEPAKDDTTEQTTTSTTPQRDPAAKLEMQRAVTAYNAGYREFRARIERTSNLDALKAAIADYRTVIFEFDKDLRAIDFDDSLVPQVNSILESNRNLIAQLDEMRNAGDFDEVIAEFEAFQKDRTPTINAVNRLLDQL